MADEALACFNAILDSVPGWIADLENIVESSIQRQNAFLSANQPSHRPTRSRTSSTASSAPSRKRARRDSEDRQQTSCLTNSDALRLLQRKRRTASVCSAPRSGPSDYRSKPMVKVYFDGETQKQFETLVRSIGTCRNTIRKGKLSAKLDSLSRSGSSSSQSSSSSGEETVKGLGTFTYHTTTTYRRPDGLFNGKSDGTQAFDNVDGFLERAQMLCERAAHQVLRDGDCTSELERARELFNDASHAVRSELPSLLKRSNKAALRRHHEEEADVPTERVPEQDHSVTDLVPMDHITFPSDGALEVDDNEVDDDDEPINGEFNISTLQLPPHLTKYWIGRGRGLSGTLTAIR